MSLDAAQEVSVEVAAPQLDCFTAIVDFEHYPEWSGQVTRTRVLEFDAAGEYAHGEKPGDAEHQADQRTHRHARHHASPVILRNKATNILN